MAAKKKASKRTAQKKKVVRKKAAKKGNKFEPKDEAEKIKGSAFTLQEEMYCIAYCGKARGNKAKASRLARYSKSVTDVGIYEIHRRPYIQKRIEILTEELVKDLKMSPEEIEAEWGAIARFDVRNLFHEDGRLLQPEELDDATARAVSSIKVRQEFSGNGEDREHVSDLIEIKVVDKNSALSNYARSQGMFKDTVVVDPSESMQKILEKINGTSLGPPALRSGKDSKDSR